MKMVHCYDLHDVADVANRNTETIVRMIQRANGEIGRLKRKNRSNAMAGFIFGIAVELCFLAQNQKISNMNEEIKELRDKEGD